MKNPLVVGYRGAHLKVKLREFDKKMKSFNLAKQMKKCGDK